MTLWDLIRSMFRRWPVVLLGAALTLSIGYVAAGDHSVYWTKTQVVFLAPSSSTYPNSLETTSEDLIITAGAVAKELTGPAKTIKLTSPDANLIGRGITDGWSVKLPDNGGQWAPNFDSQWLDVEVAAATPEQVTLRVDALIKRIAATLAHLQAERGVSPVNAITTKAAPDSTVVYRMTGSRMRVLAMTLALGIGATVWVVLILDYRARNRMTAASRRRRKHADRTQDAASEREPVPAR